MNDYFVQGAVRYADGSPAPGIRLSLGSSFAVTDGQGGFRFGEPGEAGSPFVVLTRPAGWSADIWWARIDGAGTSRGELAFTLSTLPQTLPYTLVQLSDVHATTRNLVHHGAYESSLYSEGSFANEVKALLSGIPGRIPGAQSIVITGDLTDFGLPEEYDELAGAIRSSPLPVMVIPGNHDHMRGTHTSVVTRNGYLTNDGDPAAYEDHLGPRWFSFDLPQLHVVAIDWHTHELGLDDEAQEQWIRADLGMLPPGSKWLLLSHDQPAASILNALPWPPVGILSGHWHADRVVRRENTLHVNTAPALFGGLDAAPPMLRAVTWDGRTLSTRAIRHTDEPAPAPVREGDSELTTAITVDARFGELSPKPIVAGSLVVVGAADSDAPAGCVRAYEASTGTPAWSVRTIEPVKAPPVSDGRYVVVREVGGMVLVVDASSGRQLWSRQVGDLHRTFAWASPLLHDGVIVVGEPQDIRAFDAPTGRELWRRHGMAPHHNLVNHASPILAGDLVVLGTWPVPTRPIALDLTTGEDRWSAVAEEGDYFGADGPMSIGTAAYDPEENSVIVPGHGRTTSLDQVTGGVRWSVPHPGGSSPATPLVTAEGYVVSITGEGFRMLDKRDGSVLWNQARSNDTKPIRTPYAKVASWTSGGAALWNNHLVLSGSDGMVTLTTLQGLDERTLDVRGPVRGVSVTASGTLAAVIGLRTLRLVDLKSSEVVA